MKSKKIIIGTVVCMVVLGLFTGCHENNKRDIGKEQAKTTALSDAGITESEITRLKINRDEDDGKFIYEVDFTVSSTNSEYDYEISAEDGQILEVNKETSESNNATLNQSQNLVEQSQQTISQEEAIKLVLDKVPGATEQDLRIKLEQDDGIQKYEGDLIYEGKEYNFEIDASTGVMLEWEEERMG